MNDKIYPAIYESSTSNRYLYSDSCNYYHLESNIWCVADEIDKRSALTDKNITHEYLKNTWGSVESKEHAEFIVEMAENAGFELFATFNHDHDHFFISESELVFTYGKPAIDSTDKQITIPLPPKSKPNFSDLPKHFDCVCNKCGGKCCTGQCDNKELSDWPQVGDEICWSNGKRKGELKSMCDGWAWVKDDSGEFISLMAKYIKKPKSPQDLLIEELQTKLCENNAVDNYILACDIINGDIEGLEYNGSEK